MNDRVKAWLSITLFLAMAGYVGFSTIRLGLLLWQRFGIGA